VLKLAGLFLVTALLYASVGFGGGSTYNALLVLADTDYVLLPSIALICNIIVVTGGTLRFHRKKLIPWDVIWPLLFLSVPFAWFGGQLLIDRELFILLLGLTLLVAGILMLMRVKVGLDAGIGRHLGPVIPVTGMGIGFLSGLVGIGGGIFLAPVLHLLKWASVRTIAGTCSAFILVNSIAGLTGQLMKLGDISRVNDITSYWPLFVAVFVGGQIGSMAGRDWLNPKWVRLLTAILILFVAVRLLVKSLDSFGWVS